MKKYFIISDIHGFYYEFLDALHKKGFDPKMKNHILVICGDLFDRGPENVKVYYYLKKLPKSRCILIRGNHEQLLLDIVDRGYFIDDDIHNGTANSLIQLAGYYNMDIYDVIINELTDVVINSFKRCEVYRWLKSKRWINYLELKHHIITHSFVPLKGSFEDVYKGNTDKLEYNADWRHTSQLEWDDATWGCPYKFIDAGLWHEDKKLVCGHWSACDFHTHYNGDAPYVNHNIYEDDHVVALDGCTALSYQVNVYTIEE